MLKKIVLIITLFFCSIIVFFSVMGETIFYEWCPQVSISPNYGVMLEDGTMQKMIPKTALYEGKYVYTVETVQGFSADIHTLVRHEVTVMENPNEYSDNYIVLTGGENLRNVAGIIENGEPKEGIRVNVVEQDMSFWW